MISQDVLTEAPIERRVTFADWINLPEDDAPSQGGADGGSATARGATPRV